MATLHLETFSVVYVKSNGHILRNLIILFTKRLKMDKEETFTINYAKLITEKSLLSVTRLLASDLSSNPYLTIGDFLKELSLGDLEKLVNIIDEGEDHPNFEDLILISGMLSSAEGIPCSTVDDYHKCANQLTTFIVCESLGRKGFVKVIHENMSFGEDMKNEIIVEKLHD